MPEDGFEQRVTPRGENYFRPSDAPGSARRKQGSLRRSLLDDLTDDVRFLHSHTTFYRDFPEPVRKNHAVRIGVFLQYWLGSWLGFLFRPSCALFI